MTGKRKAQDDEDEFESKLQELRTLTIMYENKTGLTWLFSAEEPIRVKVPLMKLYCPTSGLLSKSETKPRLCGRCQCFRESTLKCVCGCSYSICSVCELVFASERRRVMEQMLNLYRKDRREWVEKELTIIKEMKARPVVTPIKNEDLPTELRCFLEDLPEVDLNKIDSFVF